MRESIITVILSVLSGLMLIGAVIGIMVRDNTAPVISLTGKNNLTYTEGQDYDVLLEDMTAEDDRDGDVTDSLRVSNLYVTAKDRAMILYVAKDSSNNIGKLKREVRYVPKPEPVVVEEVTEEEAATTETTETAAPAPQQTTQVETQTEEANGEPRVIMLQNEATLKVGETFNIFRYVQRAIDGQGNDISRSMHLEGNYDMNTPGVYTLQIYALDAAQVRTNVETFTLTVEP
jgi:hypothetical protein